MSLPLALVTVLAAPPEVVVDRDDVVIRETCTVRVGSEPIRDVAGDGVVRIVGDGITVEFVGERLRGAADDVAPDTLTGVGIRITGERVTVRGARVSGFKAGIVAQLADGLVIEDCDVSGNFRQRLGSTPQREDVADWLRPHENDANEWLDRYGAALWIEDSSAPTVRRLRVRDGQNGIVLDQVSGARIHDNDCSFLSGWGLAMWRTSDSLVSENAFDFCIRGYSHDVYNRGQDSAGILMFEQCSRN
ncbi:MAG: right-handed parallel beta-helix repeat-containing protein, partial [Planctomycetota bacterium]